MRIFLVMQDFPYETTVFEGAYSSLEKAESRRLEFPDPTGYETVYIVETELDGFEHPKFSSDNTILHYYDN